MVYQTPDNYIIQMLLEMDYLLVLMGRQFRLFTSNPIQTGVIIAIDTGSLHLLSEIRFQWSAAHWDMRTISLTQVSTCMHICLVLLFHILQQIEPTTGPSKGPIDSTS